MIYYFGYNIIYRTNASMLFMKYITEEHIFQH